VANEGDRPECPVCGAATVDRRAGFYLDGRSLYICASCGRELVDENETPSVKALVALRRS